MDHVGEVGCGIQVGLEENRHEKQAPASAAMTRGSFQSTIGMNRSTDTTQEDGFNVSTKVVVMTRDVGGYHFVNPQGACGLYTLQSNQGVVPTKSFAIDIDP